MNEANVSRYEPIAVSTESTVVAEFIPDATTDVSYQSEADLEREFIKLLQSQAYEYLPITSEIQLIANLRTQIEALNSLRFSDTEWDGDGEVRVGANPLTGVILRTVLDCLHDVVRKP